MYVPQKNRWGFNIVREDTANANKFPLCFLNKMYNIIPATMVNAGIKYFIINQFSPVISQTPAMIHEIN